jgi:PAS domain S-box-containing protein
MKGLKNLDIISVIQLLKLNNPFYIITNNKKKIQYFSEAANKIFELQLNESKSISCFFNEIDLVDYDKNKTFFLTSICKTKKFKFKALLFEELIIFVFSPVVNYLNPITKYNLSANDFDSINYLSEYIFLAETTRGSLEDYDKINILLKKQNKELREKNKTIESLGRFPMENPNPVLRVNSSKEIIYKNSASNSFLKNLKLDNNNILKSSEITKAIEEVINSKKNSKRKVIFFKDSTFNLTIKYDNLYNDFNLYLTDISEYHEEINTLKNFYEEILDQVPVDIAVFDKNNCFVYINKKAIQDDKTRNYLIGKTDEDYFRLRNKPIHLAQERKQKIKETFNNRTSTSWVDEYNNLDNKRYVLRKLNPVINDKNEVKRVVGTGVDITKTIEYKNSVIKNEQKWKTLVKGSSDLICVLNTECNIIFISNSVKNILGYSAKELISSSLKKIIHKDDILDPEECYDKSNTSKVNHKVMRFRNSSENFIPLRVSMRYDDEIYKNPCIILNGQDISELKKAENQRFMTGIAAEENERRRLARDLHDGVGQYLATTVLYSSLLGKYVENEMSSEGKEIYYNTVKMLKKATEEVRSVSHNIMPSSMKDFGFLKSIRQLIKDLRLSNPEINFIYNENTISNNIGFSEHIGLHLFRSIQQIFNNSLKHGKPTIIKLSISYKNNEVKIAILDNGVGFDTSLINYKEGIGMKSIYDRISNIGGEMNVLSKTKKGTLVRIDIKEIIK